MDDPVKYEELRPAQFRRRLAERPVAYLPLGTLEWHGEHMPLGTDAIISEALMIECARVHGGIVMPPIHLGPDRASYDHEGNHLQGMDTAETTKPHRQLDGSCYWVEEEVFGYFVDCILAQLDRAGFEAVFADGHGPSRWSWVKDIEQRESHFDLKLLGVTEDYCKAWLSQTDHAALNETSLMLATRPDLVDLDQLPERLSDIIQGVSGCDPRQACPDIGAECREICIQLVGKMLEEAGL